MKITILTYGSRGDVQPFIPLSLGLMQRGHSVKLVAPARFMPLVQEHGIHFVPLAGDPEDLSRRFNDAGYNFIRMFRELMNHAVDIGADVFRQSEEACIDADLIIHTFAHAVGGHTLARKRNIPDIHIQGFPMFSPTGDYPNVTMPDWKLRPLNRFTHEFAQRLTWWGARYGFEQVRRRAGIPKQQLYFPFEDDATRSPTPILCAWSPSVLPPSGDWNSNVHVTGYFFLDPDLSYKPSKDLQRFLDEGEAPVCVSFGSMINRDAERIDIVVRRALQQLGQRGIFLSGWSEVSRSPSNDLLYLDAASHDWLLPRCKMIIHHGGAGTTSAGLRAGIPNVVIPHTADQPFWGNRVHSIGAGPKPIQVNKLSVENLTAAITEVDREGFREGAQSIGQKLKNEDGVRNAVNLIEEYSNNFLR